MIQTDELILCHIIILTTSNLLSLFGRRKMTQLVIKICQTYVYILLSVRYIIVQYRLTVKFTQRQS